MSASLNLRVCPVFHGRIGNPSYIFLATTALTGAAVCELADLRID